AVARAAGALVSTGALLGLPVGRPDGPRPLGRTARMLAACAVTIGLAAMLVVPAAWALSSVLVPGPGAIPSADLARLVPAAGGALAPGRTVAAYDTAGPLAVLHANPAGGRQP